MCLYSLVLTAFPKTKLAPDSSKALFLAIAQGNAHYVDQLLKHSISANIQREDNGNSPLIEAIITLGEKLIEMETQILAQDLADPKNITDDFRSFLRSFIVSLIIGVSASEIQTNVQRINNKTNNNPFIALLQSLSNSFLPVISRSAFVWCAYSLLDYGIATGQKNTQNQSNNGSSALERYKKTIDVLLSKPTINVNHINNHGESALSLVRLYKNKVKTSQLKIILYHIEQALIHEGAHSCTNHYNYIQNY